MFSAKSLHEVRQFSARQRRILGCCPALRHHAGCRAVDGGANKNGVYVHRSILVFDGRKCGVAILAGLAWQRGREGHAGGGEAPAAAFVFLDVAFGG